MGPVNLPGVKAGGGVHLNPLTTGTGGRPIAPKAPSAPKPPKPPKPAAATPAVPAAPAAPATAPLDATALANIAAYLQKTGQSITADQGKIDNYQQQQPIAQLRLMTAANAGGGLYGSAYGQQQGNLTAQYNSNIGALRSAIAGLQASEPLEGAQEASASTDRATQAAEKNAPASPPTAPAPPPALQKATTAARAVQTNLNPSNRSGPSRAAMQRATRAARSVRTNLNPSNR